MSSRTVCNGLGRCMLSFFDYLESIGALFVVVELLCLILGISLKQIRVLLIGA